MSACYRTERTPRDGLDVVPVWAGEALDLIAETASATDIVAELAAGAERALALAQRT
ncbi:hypothetical protein AB0C11_29195 [Streptomyces sp. NPDC039016]|uniref:hypothetical protein n=1 Tax=unclassified Streptomyces TaxID=2593676 RepID=UPI0015E09563|nr:hypothetical protein [Streptomyces sp. CB02959]